MLLSRRHQFIYTKTLKTAGTSVEIYFQGACLPAHGPTMRTHHAEQTISHDGIIGYRGGDPSGRTYYNHMPARDIRDRVGADVWNSYYRFCVVRNPFDKLVSLWWFNRAKEGKQCPPAEFPSVRETFCAWCRDHAPLAVDRDKYLIDGQVVVDFFIRYEALLDGLQHVCQQVGYPFVPQTLGNFKSEFRTDRRPYHDYFDRFTIEVVEQAFAWEFDNFGYDRLSAVA